MSSFFLKKKNSVNRGLANRKRKRPSASTVKSKIEDEEIPSDDEDEVADDSIATEEVDDDEAVETAEEKRLRLTKAYLEEIEREERERLGEENGQGLHEAVQRRLQQDDLEKSGKLVRHVAKSLAFDSVPDIAWLRDRKSHVKSVTCVCTVGEFFFSASKDGGISKWDFSGQRLGRVARSGKAINTLAASSDAKLLAAGDDSATITIFTVSDLALFHTFRGHRDSVSGLAFRRNSHTLYSCSLDRSVKVWDVDERAYVETLFGHQDRVTGIDAGLRERPVTSGGRDGSVRVWKIVEESQLVYNGPATSVDSVRLINEEHFVTCGEDGHISLWGVMKKKPLCTRTAAHGLDTGSGTPNWISAVATFPMSDLLASGSCDGRIRLWRGLEGFRGLDEIGSVELEGFVNGLAFSEDGHKLVAAVGQEHRLGRWKRIPEAKNGIAIISLDFSSNSVK